MVLSPRGYERERASHPVQSKPAREQGPKPRSADREPPRKASEIAGITVLLMIVNVAMLGLMVSSGASLFSPNAADLVPWGANHGPLTLRGDWWRLITACFIHGGLIHLGFNMYVLWDLGRVTEHIYGSLGFLLVYMVAGIGGSFASVMLHPLVTSVGASGAVFGVAGAFLAFLLRNRSRIHPQISAHLRRSLVTFVAFNLVLGFAIPGIDQAAHIGGLVTGFLAGFLASPRIGPNGPERAYWAYPIVVMTGALLCAITWSGLSPFWLR
jgi:rhomboid protease GluP